MRRQPDHAVAQFDLAVVYQTMGRKEDARAHYLIAKSLDTPPDMAAVIDQLPASSTSPPGRGCPRAPVHPVTFEALDPGYEVRVRELRAPGSSWRPAA